MKLFFAVALLILASLSSVLGQDPTVVRTSPLADSGRYEYIRAPKENSPTFRLDKYTGKIHRLTTCPRDDTEGSRLCLKEMVIIEPAAASSSSRVRFQIYIDSLARTTFLFDLETGKAWQWGLEQYEKWHPFLECNERVVTCIWRP